MKYNVFEIRKKALQPTDQSILQNPHKNRQVSALSPIIYQVREI